MSELPPAPVDGDALFPWLPQVASTYASGRQYGIYRSQPSQMGVTVPFPTAEELDALYASHYDYGAHSLIANEKRWRNRKLVDRAVTALDGTVPGRALDVGCMYGYLLDELRARQAGILHGIEIAEQPARVAAAKGYAIHQGTIEDYVHSRPDVTFDAVFAQHVLEHVRDPALFLRSAFTLLRPGGILVLAVPNLGSRTQRLFPRAWGWYQVPAHLFHFSDKALTALCQKAGFTVEAPETRGGDSLFLLMTLSNLARRAAAGQPAPLSPIEKLAVRAGSLLLRPYLYLGDEELVLVASKPL